MNPKRLEVIWTYLGGIRHELFVAFGCSLGSEDTPPRRSGKRQAVRAGYGPNTWQSFRSFDQLAEKRRTLLSADKTWPGQCHLKSQKVLWIKAGIDLRRLPQALKADGGEEDRGKTNRYLRGHKDDTEAPRLESTGQISSTRLQSGTQIDLAALDGRHQTKEKSGAHADEKREAQYPPIQMELHEVGQTDRKARWQGKLAQVKTPPGKEQAKSAAESRENKTFHEQLPDHAKAVCTQSTPHADFRSAMQRTHQEQTREVGAANYQDCSSDCQKKKEDRTRTFEPFSERCNPNLQTRIEAGKIRCQPCGDCLDFRTSLFHADP